MASAKMPKIPRAHSQGMGELGIGNPEEGRAVVVTVTVRGAAVLALTVTVGGTEQTAFAGAPPQVSVAVPPRPSPPILTL